MRNVIEHLVLSGPILGLILAPVVFGIVQALKLFWTALDRAPAWAKQGASIAVAFALFGLAHFIPNFHPPEACGTVDGLTQACKDALASKDFLMPIVTAILANLLHLGRKNANKLP